LDKLSYTLYPVIGVLPLKAGAVHETRICPFPPLASTAVGAPGEVQVVAVLDGAELNEGPNALVAVTV
jgi:hypothetical protein